MRFEVRAVFDGDRENALTTCGSLRSALAFTMRMSDMRLTPLAEPPLMSIVELLADGRVILAMRVVRR